MRDIYFTISSWKGTSTWYWWDLNYLLIYGEKWVWNTFVIDNIFSFQVATNIIRNDEDPKLETMDECQHRKDWPKWKEYILTNLDSLEKWEVFGLVVQMPEVVKLVGYKWVFIRKCNEKNEITIYKMWLIAQGF